MVEQDIDLWEEGFESPGRLEGIPSHGWGTHMAKEFGTILEIDEQLSDANLMHTVNAITLTDSMMDIKRSVKVTINITSQPVVSDEDLDDFHFESIIVIWFADPIRW